MRLRLFAPLRDKVTSSAQSLVPPSGRPSQGSSLSILTEPHDELAAFHTRSPRRRYSRNGSYGISGPRAERPYSGLTLAARITLAHFSVSLAMSLPNSAGVIGIGAPPSSTRRALSLGSARPALISRFSVAMISGGVFLGALTLNHTLTS